ncbi:MAG TPA: hypothetical protein VN039_09415 [Nitrospira sp.]|nr:hypothetical protein [Nitrospira sp.]
MNYSADDLLALIDRHDGHETFYRERLAEDYPLVASLAAKLEGKPLDRGEWERRVLDEGERQVALGYTPEHDREHGPDHLILEGLERAFRGDTVQVGAMLLALRRLLADTDEPKGDEQ